LKTKFLEHLAEQEKILQEQINVFYKVQLPIESSGLSAFEMAPLVFHTWGNLPVLGHRCQYNDHKTSVNMEVVVDLYIFPYKPSISQFFVANLSPVVTLNTTRFVNHAEMLYVTNVERSAALTTFLYKQTISRS
jgi:hypothetical protein